MTALVETQVPHAAPLAVPRRGMLRSVLSHPMGVIGAGMLLVALAARSAHQV